MTRHFITLQNKKHFYTLKPLDKKTTFVECEAANIAQDFLNEDIPALLIDLPNLILSEKKYRNAEKTVVRFRITVEDKELIEKKALENGYDTVSGYLRDLALGD